MKKIILSISGMTCSACSSGLEKYLNKQQGILDATVNLVMQTASISYEDNLTIEDLNKYVKEAGFESNGKYDETLELNKNKSKKRNLILFTIISIILMYITMGHMLNLPSIIDQTKYPIIYSLIQFLITIIYLIYGKDILISGYKNIKHKTPNMDTLVSIGVLSSFLYSIYNTILIIIGHTNLIHHLYYESSCIVIYFIKLGRYIDSKSKDKTKEAIKRLVSITPSKAIKLVNGEEIEITLDEINKGDILLCKPGMKIAVDGIITKGTTHTDESFITGESIPVKKKKDDNVIAGSINYDGYIEYKAINIGRESTISNIVKLVVEATNTKAPIAKIADKVSNYFVPIIIIIAIISFIGTIIITHSLSDSINTFVSILVVACPCALGLATPLAIVVGEGLCAKQGILVKTSETLETANKIDTIIFDKTGTLTEGKLTISNIINKSNYKEKELLKIVCSIETLSSHPISNAFKLYQDNNNLNLLEVTNFNNISGYGIKGTINKKDYILCNSKYLDKLNIKNNYIEEETNLSNQGNSIIYIVEDNIIISIIGVKDTIRKESKETINKLHKLNKKVIMLTGDNDKTAKVIANELGIKEIISNVIPSKKAEVIKNLKEKGNLVMMIGDGINDAPSLANATIGVSLSNATDIASDSSSVLLLNDNLLKIIDLITISKKTLTIIKQNLFWAFFYNICMIPIAIGILKPFNIILNPMIASLAMMLSSITVILNTLRLNKGSIHEKNK